MKTIIRKLRVPIISLTILTAFFLSSMTPLQGQENKAPLKLKVVTEQANIRLKPDIGSTIIYQVPLGTFLEYLGKEGDWYKVQLKSKEGETVTGYVHESLIATIRPIPQEALAKEEPVKEEAPPKERETEFEESQIISPPPVEPTQFKPFLSPVQISFSGGGNFFLGGDLNKGAQGLADLYEDILSAQRNGEIRPAHLSYIAGGELTIRLHSSVFLGIGVDYFKGKKESQVELIRGKASYVFTTCPKIQAIPIKLMISYFPVPSFYIKSGIEYYFAQCTYYYHIQADDFWENWEGKSKAQELGLMGGLGIVQNVSSHLSLFLEGTGRYARITGFKGTNYFEDSTGFSSSEEGTLYIYQGQISEEKSYPLLFIRKKRPAEAGVLNPALAMIDLSGFSLTAGIRIHF